MLRRSACHVDPEDSVLLSCAASRIEDLQSENRKLKQRFKSMDRDMRAILDQFDISEHPVVEALQGLFLIALDDDDVFEDIHGNLETATTPSSFNTHSKSRRDIAREQMIELLKSVQKLQQQGKMTKGRTAR